MSERLEAAMKAHREAPRTRGMDTSGPMRAALKGSDAAMFSDESVGQVADGLREFFNDAFPLQSIVGDPYWTRPELRLAVRKVFEAITKAEQ